MVYAKSGHETQSRTVARPSSGLYVLCGQLVQGEGPAVALNVPAGHSTQTEQLSRMQCSPLPHARHSWLEIPVGQPVSLYTPSTSSHDESSTGATVLLPKQRRPGGQFWHVSVFGLAMYCSDEHSRHCWLSWVSVRRDVPSGQATSVYSSASSERAGSVRADCALGARGAHKVLSHSRRLVTVVATGALLQGGAARGCAHTADSAALLRAVGVEGTLGTVLSALDLLVGAARAHLALGAVLDEAVVPCVADLALLLFQAGVVLAVSWRAAHEYQIFPTFFPDSPGGNRRIAAARAHQADRALLAVRVQRVQDVLTERAGHALLQVVREVTRGRKSRRVHELVVCRAIHKQVLPVLSSRPGANHLFSIRASRGSHGQGAVAIRAFAANGASLTVGGAIAELPDVRPRVTKAILNRGTSIRARVRPGRTGRAVSHRFCADVGAESARRACSTRPSVDNALVRASLARSALLALVKRALFPNPARAALHLPCDVEYAGPSRAAHEPVNTVLNHPI
eukprot:3534270-Rhodomonas_salina.2